MIFRTLICVQFSLGGWFRPNESRRGKKIIEEFEIKRTMSVSICLVFALLSIATETFGHGVMMDPVSRASRWRVDGSKPRDYSDKEGKYFTPFSRFCIIERLSI